MKRRQYADEYKRDALELVKLNGSLRATARELGIDEKTLRRWAQQYHRPTSVSELKQADRVEKEELIRRQKKQLQELEKQVKLLTDATVFLSTEKQMKYQYIEQHRNQGLSLERICKLLGVSRSGYHSAVKWLPSGCKSISNAC